MKLLVSHPDIDINLANEMVSFFLVLSLNMDPCTPGTLFILSLLDHLQSGETALHIACRRSSVEVVKVLLAGRRIQVNLQDKVRVLSLFM